MIRVAILGAGIGAEHLAGYRALRDMFDVSVICDLDAGRAEAIAGGIRVETDAAKVMADPTIDLIDVLLCEVVQASSNDEDGGLQRSIQTKLPSSSGGLGCGRSNGVSTSEYAAEDIAVVCAKNLL